MIDTRQDTATASQTAAICENIALYGASPERGEIDSREIWDEDDATEALSEAIRIMVDGVTVEGTQMADEREALMWSLVNCFHAQIGRLDRAVDRITPEMKDLEAAQDGTEVKAWELQLLTARAQNLGDRRDAFETLRDTAADAYLAETNDIWRPRNGSHTSKTGALTSAAIDARDYRRARKDSEMRAHLPQGTLVAVTGGKEVADPAAVWSVLDRTHEKHGDSRVGGWRASFRVRWLIRRFRSGPQSVSLGRVSSPPLIKPDVRFSRIRLSDEIMPSRSKGPWSAASDGGGHTCRIAWGPGSARDSTSASYAFD